MGKLSLLGIRFAYLILDVSNVSFGYILDGIPGYLSRYILIYTLHVFSVSFRSQWRLLIFDQHLNWTLLLVWLTVLRPFVVVPGEWFAGFVWIDVVGCIDPVHYA